MIGCTGCNAQEGELHKSHCPELARLNDKCSKCGGDLDTGFECNDCGADHLPASALPSAPEPSADTPPPVDRNSEEYALYAHRVMVSAFKHLLDRGYDALDINAIAIGMCRRSVEDLVGLRKAVEWDKAARKRIGWDKARIIYPAQNVRGRH